MGPRVIGCALLIGATAVVHAQEAFTDALLPAPAETSVAEQQHTGAFSAGLTTPQNAWIDLRQHVDASATTQAAPTWVESVRMIAARDQNNGSPKTVFRIQVAQPPGDYRILFFRLFFDDKPNARPQLTAWDESGTQLLHSGELGIGISLPSSDSALIPMQGISLIDIEVPGDGATVRGAYLDWMTSSEVAHPLAAQHRDVIPEPFSSMPPLHPPAEDTEKFGTVTATLAAETIQIGPDVQDAAMFEFGVEAQPLLAVLTFDVASPHIATPPQVYLNGEDIGPVSLILPELADPAYRGEMEPLLKQMQFRYTGWLRAQKVVPLSSLKIGANSLIIASSDSSAAAIRSTQIQLKYLWDKSDYILQPAH
ncbi:MAG: hypothetical protein ABR514_02480 [Chthoniobacterales bacterium]